MRNQPFGFCAEWKFSMRGDSALADSQRVRMIATPRRWTDPSRNVHLAARLPNLRTRKSELNASGEPGRGIFRY